MLPLLATTHFVPVWRRSRELQRVRKGGPRRVTSGEPEFARTRRFKARGGVVPRAIFGDPALALVKLRAAEVAARGIAAELQAACVLAMKIGLGSSKALGNIHTEACHAEVFGRGAGGRKRVLAPHDAPEALRRLGHQLAREHA